MQTSDLTKNIFFIGNLFEAGMQSNKKDGLYGIVPSLKNPRWLIPLKKNLIISSLAMYQPSLLRAKAIKQFAILLAKLGLFNFFVINKVRFEKNDFLVRNIFKKNSLDYAVFGGTPGYHCKTTIQVMAKDGLILGYIKVADNADLNDLLDNEVEILQYLSKLNVKSVSFPKVIKKYKIENVNILILDTERSIYSKFTSKLSKAHICSLSELFKKDSNLIKFKESNFFNQLPGKIQSIPNNINSSWKQSFVGAYNYVNAHIGDEVVPFGICQRDFTPWNTFFTNAKLYIFDWEYAQKEYPPAIDLFHFIVQDCIYVRKLSPRRILERIGEKQSLFEMYFELLNINQQFLFSLLLCYLIDESLLFILRAKGVLEKEVYKAGEIRVALIDLVLKKAKK